MSAAQVTWCLCRRIFARDVVALLDLGVSRCFLYTLSLCSILLTRVSSQVSRKQLICPIPDCKTPLTAQEVRSCLADKHELLVKYEQFTLHNYLRKDASAPTFFCPTVGCAFAAEKATSQVVHLVSCCINMGFSSIALDGAFWFGLNEIVASYSSTASFMHPFG